MVGGIRVGRHGCGHAERDEGNGRGGRVDRVDDVPRADEARGLAPPGSRPTICGPSREGQRYPPTSRLVKPRRLLRRAVTPGRSHGRFVRHLSEIPAFAARFRGDPGDARLFRAAPVPADGDRDGGHRPGRRDLERGRAPRERDRARDGDALRAQSVPARRRGRGRPRPGAHATPARRGGGRRPHDAAGGGGAGERTRGEQHRDQRIPRAVDQ